MITRVALENWKSHSKSEFEFSAGTNVLVGVSGSGKTSVMDAICFGLYGTFPQANAREVKLDEIIMNKPVLRDHANVLIEFEYNKKNYEVSRTIFRNSSNQATLKENGRLIAGPKPSEVNKRIEEITDVNFDLFTRAIYSEQNQTDYFLKLNPAQRKEKIDDLLLINRYELVRANAVGMQNRLKKQAEDKKEWLKEIRQNFSEKELEATAEKIRQKKELIEKANKEIKVLQEKLKKTGEKIALLQKKEEEFRFFNELLIRSHGHGEELKKNIAHAKHTIGKKSIQELAVEQKGTAEKRKLLEKELSELHAQGKKNQNELKKNSQLMGALIEKNSQKEKQLRELWSAKGTCPVCSRSLEEHIKGELLKEVQKEKHKTETELFVLEKMLKEMQKKEQAIEEKTGKTQEKIDAASKEEAKTAEVLTRAKELFEKEKQQKSLEEEIQKLRIEIERTGFSQKELDGQRQVLTDEKEKIFSLQQGKKSAAELIEQLEQSEKKLLETKKQIVELEKNAEQIAEMAQKTAIFVNALKETQAELRNSLINSVNEAMHDIWQNIYPYGDFESTKIEINETGNYEILVKQKNGPWTRVEGILSGGERSCVALTIRIAVSLVLTQNLSWLILDEPTHNLDSNTVARLSQMMKNHLPELVEQIFIITHDKEMELAANGSLYFLERDKDSNSPTKPNIQEIK